MIPQEAEDTNASRLSADSTTNGQDTAMIEAALMRSAKPNPRASPARAIGVSRVNTSGESQPPV